MAESLWARGTQPHLSFTPTSWVGRGRRGTAQLPWGVVDSFMIPWCGSVVKVWSSQSTRRPFFGQSVVWGGLDRAQRSEGIEVTALWRVLVGLGRRCEEIPVWFIVMEWSGSFYWSLSSIVFFSVVMPVYFSLLQYTHIFQRIFFSIEVFRFALLHFFLRSDHSYSGC